MFITLAGLRVNEHSRGVYVESKKKNLKKHSRKDGIVC